MIKSLDEAFQILEAQKQGIPWDAIRYVRSQSPIEDILLQYMFESWERGDIEEGFEQLKSGIVKYPEFCQPYCDTREEWEDYYKQVEHRFFDNDEEADISVLEPQQKIGRNDPCPCGSGKKYKKCHGAQ